ncbi:MAG: thioredoxin [Planctomycetota bacterium]|nr:MAG: thioredoxin [Planctomycetota bacterium]
MLLAACDSPPPSATGDSLPEVTDQTWEAEVAKSPLPVLVDFHATWCGPCKVLAPVVEEIARERKGALKVVKVDVDAASATAARFEVRSVPTLIVFRDGKEVRRRVGAGPKAAVVKELHD